MIREDEEHPEELRYDILGRVGKIIFVVCAFRDRNVIRMISARLATTSEKERYEPVFDDDSPMLMREQLMQFKRINHENRTKPTISLRISPATLKKAKQYGKGYTGLLSRLLDAAIDDEDLVRKCI